MVRLRNGDTPGFVLGRFTYLCVHSHSTVDVGEFVNNVAVGAFLALLVMVWSIAAKTPDGSGPSAAASLVFDRC